MTLLTGSMQQHLEPVVPVQRHQQPQCKMASCMQSSRMLPCQVPALLLCALRGPMVQVARSVSLPPMPNATAV